jgi:hypothetical protein
MRTNDMRLAHPRALVALLATALALTAAAPRAALAGCELRPDLNIMGLTLVTPSEGGRINGRWLGAYPLACDGETYQLVVGADALAILQRAAADPSVGGSVYVMGDFPYFGDGVCVSGAVRRWWEPGAVEGEEASQRWQATHVPLIAPAFPCPVNQPGDAALVLQPGG